ncbi:MAG: hypothetical protein AB7T49_18490 [Oligoflexales bacterium]
MVAAEILRCAQDDEVRCDDEVRFDDEVRCIMKSVPMTNGLCKGDGLVLRMAI